MPGVFLARSVGHVHRRITDHLNVVYYVADTFSEEYTGSSLKTVERNVEDDYIANLRNNCWKEKQQSECACVGDREPENRDGGSPARPVICGPSTWHYPVPATSQPRARLHPLVSLEISSRSCESLQPARRWAARSTYVSRD